MARPVQIVERPFIHPNVCVQCGKQDGRQYFVDIGIEINVLYQPLFEGSVYFCKDCFENLIRDYYDKAADWNHVNMEATFEYVSNTDEEQQTIDFDGGYSDSGTSGSNTWFAEANPGTDPIPESNDASDSEPVGDSQEPESKTALSDLFLKPS